MKAAKRNKERAGMPFLLHFRPRTGSFPAKNSCLFPPPA